MCLALPARVAALLPDEMAVVDLGGVRKEISLALTPEARVGDYVIVHAGFALHVMTPQEAEDSLSALRELAQALEGTPANF